MRQNERVRAVADARDPGEAFSKAQELTLGDFFEEGQPTEKMIRCEGAVRQARDGLCEKYELDRLRVLQMVATMVARVAAVELTHPEDEAGV